MARPHKVKYTYDPSVVVKRREPTFDEQLDAWADCLAHPRAEGLTFAADDPRCEVQPGPPILKRFKPKRADGTEADKCVWVNFAPRCLKPAVVTRHDKTSGRPIYLCYEHAR